MNESIKQLARKYRDGILSEADARELASYLGESNNKAEFRRALDESTSAHVTKDALKFWSRFREHNSERFAGKSAAPPRKRSSIKKRRSWRWGTALAVAASTAAAAFLAGTRTHWRTPATATAYFPLDTAAGRATASKRPQSHGFAASIILPDGTAVSVAKGTLLTLSEDFNTAAREVSLDGEAFFEVAKDSSRLFIVRSGTNEYIVRGTSFNIFSYSEDDMSVVTLHSGTLEARVNGDVINLQQGDELLVDRSSEHYEKRRVADISQSVSWVNSDALVFDETPLKVVAMRLSRHYNVKIVIDPVIGNILYTGRRDNESLEQLLHLIELTSPVPIKVCTRGEDSYYIERKQ